MSMHIIVLCITFYRITAYHMNAIAFFYKCLPSAMYRSNRRLCLRALLQRGLLKQVKALVFICCCQCGSESIFMCSHEYMRKVVRYCTAVCCWLSYAFLPTSTSSCMSVYLSVCLSVSLFSWPTVYIWGGWQLCLHSWKLQHHLYWLL